MNARSVATVYSTLSARSRTELPAEVRERLGVGPGDSLRYVMTPEGVRIEKAPRPAADPFVAFAEWSGAIDEEDYADL